MGEEVQIKLPKSGVGRVLVSIESGSKMVQAFWKDNAEGENQVSFKATEEMSPNVYVHLTYVQPHKNVENDRPIRLYGVQQIKVEDPATHLAPVIGMPAQLAPEKPVDIKVSEKNGRHMTYTLAIVDDGLLDLTNFETPNAWSVFYAREALGIKTWDMYGYVAGAFTGDMSGLLQLGGDEYIQEQDPKKANRFKPVVRFIGPFELKPGKQNSHTLHIPNYIGSVRAMVIAGDRGAYGSAEKQCQ
ncbi:MAG: hypothetical protein HC896_09455 [Bacteroidales bacterium]|nr:hypothetical protein [Bacteroidales bacterium]